MNHPNDARRLVPDEVKQKALDLCLHEVEGFAGLSAAKKTDIHGMVVRLLAAPASPLPEGGGQLSKNLGQLKSGQCSGISGELDPRLVEWGYVSLDEAITHLGKLLDDQAAFDGLAASTGAK